MSLVNGHGEIAYLLLIHGVDVNNIDVYSEGYFMKLFGKEFVSLNSLKRWISKSSLIRFLRASNNVAQSQTPSMVKLLNISEMSRTVCDYL